MTPIHCLNYTEDLEGAKIKNHACELTSHSSSIFGVSSLPTVSNAPTNAPKCLNSNFNGDNRRLSNNLYWECKK